MLIDANKSALLVVDVQEKLMPAMAEPDQVVENCAVLMKAAARLTIPVVVSEQYPKGLGNTVPALAELAPPGSVMPKLHFSCAADPTIAAVLAAYERGQVLVVGVESHVCVLQTALDLKAAGTRCIVVADATSSRTARNKELALARLREAGVEIATTEMVLFEWLRQAGTPEFKELSRLIK